MVPPPSSSPPGHPSRQTHRHGHRHGHRHRQHRFSFLPLLLQLQLLLLLALWMIIIPGSHASPIQLRRVVVVTKDDERRSDSSGMPRRRHLTDEDKQAIIADYGLKDDAELPVQSVSPDNTVVVNSKGRLCTCLLGCLLVCFLLACLFGWRSYCYSKV